jgi:hypothetical protein
MAHALKTTTGRQLVSTTGKQLTPLDVYPTYSGAPAGFLGPTPGARVQYLDPRLDYHGTWSPGAQSDAGGEGIKFSNVLNDYMVLLPGFYGTGIRIHTYNSPSRADMRVIIDGVTYYITQSGSPINNFGYVDITGLSAGVHTLRIEVQISGQYVVINFFDIL